MINYAQERMKIIQAKIDELVSNYKGNIQDWNRMYIRLSNTKKFFDNLSWDEIIQELEDIDPEFVSIIKQTRSDEQFKQFYLLMQDMDKLKELI